MIENLLIISAAVTGIVELIKTLPFVEALSDSARNAVLFIASLIIAVLGTIGAQINLLADNPVYGQINPMVGMILTGIAVGLGSKALHAIYALLYWNKEAAKARTFESGLG